MNDKSRILRRFVRDLCTRTEEEIAGIWTGPTLKALEKVAPGGFDRVVRGHNPIYYLALHGWFDNGNNYVEDNSALRMENDFLYEPLHKDLFCKPLVDWYFAPPLDSAGLILLAQRDSYKSTFVHGAFVQFAAFRWKYIDGRDCRIGLIHHKEPLASAALKLLKAKSVHSDFLREFWPEFTSDKDFDDATSFNWPCRAIGHVREKSVIAAGLGARLTGSHFDFFLLDDVVTEEHADSRVIREAALSKYNASRFMLDTRGGKEIISGTYYHIHDLYSKLEKTGNYRVVRVQAGGRHVGQPLSFPKRHTQEFLDRKLKEYKDQSKEVLYWLQYQLDRRSEQMVASDANWIQHITRAQVQEMLLDNPDVGRVVIVDPAWKGTKNAGEGDSAAIACVFIERNGFVINRYLVDLDVSNLMSSGDGMNAIFDMMRRYGVVDCAIEEHGGYTFRTDMTQEAAKRGVYLNQIQLRTANIAKPHRISTLMRHAQSGNIFVVEGCRNVEVFLSQFEDWPQTDHDDALDAVAYSCDPNVSELYTTPFNTHDPAEKPFWARSPAPPVGYRTRHTMV